MLSYVVNHPSFREKIVAILGGPKSYAMGSLKFRNQHFLMLEDSHL